MLAKDIMEQAGITRDALRHYVKNGLLTPKIDQKNRYKHYSEEDIERIAFIKSAQKIGFTIAQINELLSTMSSAQCRHQALIPILEDHRDNINEKIATLQKMRRHINRTITHFKKKDCTKIPSTFKL